jgi:hypothetical protein
VPLRGLTAEGRQGTRPRCVWVLLRKGAQAEAYATGGGIGDSGADTPFLVWDHNAGALRRDQSQVAVARKIVAARMMKSRRSIWVRRTMQKAMPRAGIR